MRMPSAGKDKHLPWFTRLLVPVALLIFSATGCGTGSSASAVRLANGMIVDTLPEAPNKSAPIQVTAQPLKAGEPLPRPFPNAEGADYYFGVRCIVTNTSKERIAFLAAGCSWWDEWTFSDKRVNFGNDRSCSWNPIQTIMLDPHETYERVLPLSLQNVRNGDKVRFRIGFSKDIRNGYALIDLRHPGIAHEKVYWSEPIVATASRVYD